MLAGHLAMECFVGKGGKQYDLLPELDAMVPSDSEPEAEPQHMSKDTSTQRKKRKKVRPLICCTCVTQFIFKCIYLRVHTDFWTHHKHIYIFIFLPSTSLWGFYLLTCIHQLQYYFLSFIYLKYTEEKHVHTYTNTHARTHTHTHTKQTKKDHGNEYSLHNS